jgi:hypothetical protein
VTENPPGQPALAYRIGTHSSFLQTMLDRLASEAIEDGPNMGSRPLSGLGTRATDDPSIALLDAFSSVADVLTFYQERIANEGFLRTATERRSVLELARAIGYELNPGVAASTYLAFTVESATGAPKQALIHKGTKVQSVPPQGKLPQTFETTEDIQAKAEWNELRPRRSLPQTLMVQNGVLYGLQLNNGWSALSSITLAGIATNLKQGDVIMAAVRPDAAHDLGTLGLTVTGVTADAKADRTAVKISPIPTASGRRSVLTDGSIDIRGRGAGGLEIISGGAGPMFQPLLASAIPLTTDNVQQHVLSTRISERDLQATLQIAGWSGRQLIDHVAVLAGPLGAEDEGIFALRARTGFFGNTAPIHATLAKPDNLRGADPYDRSWDGVSEPTIWTDSQGNARSQVFLERAVPEVVPDSWAVFRNRDGARAYRVAAAGEASLADYGISGKAGALDLAGPAGDQLEAIQFRPGFLVRSTTAYVQSERLPLADLPIPDPVAKGAKELTLDRMVLGLQVGQAVVLAGERADAAGVNAREALLLHDIVHEGGFTTLYFATGLTYSYVRSTLTLNANAVRATHGESVTEILGTGDGAAPNQRFTLKKPPLTYVSAPTPSGAASTLQVRVSQLLWDEASSLYGLGPGDRRFIVRTDDDGKATIVFGDGQTGARLPSGQQNVVANYRSGIGPDGEVEADTLTMLQTRPLGVRGVTNPVPATGAAAPEVLEDARGNAPRTVLTLDRIVSLQDYEDFARAFAGIGKARAVALWSGERRVVHVTVGAGGGLAVDPSSDLYRNLVEAIGAAGDPSQQVAVASFQPLLFNLSAQVLVDPRYGEADVLVAARAALEHAFRFEARAFAQAVTAAEVTTAIQGVMGVQATNLFQLYLVTDPGGPEQSEPLPILPASAARFEGGVMLPAELLLLAPEGASLTPMSR